MEMADITDEWTRDAMLDSSIGGLVAHRLSPAEYRALKDRCAEVVEEREAIARREGERTGLKRAEQELREHGWYSQAAVIRSLAQEEIDK